MLDQEFVLNHNNIMVEPYRKIEINYTQSNSTIKLNSWEDMIFFIYKNIGKWNRYSINYTCLFFWGKKIVKTKNQSFKSVKDLPRKVNPCLQFIGLISKIEIYKKSPFNML